MLGAFALLTIGLVVLQFPKWVDGRAYTQARLLRARYRFRGEVRATGDVLVDSLGRRSYTTSIAYGPSIGKNIALAYLPYEYCQVGRELQIQYFDDIYPVKVEAVGYGALYDPENIKPRS